LEGATRAPLRKRLAAEFAGTFALVAIGPGAAAATGGDPSFVRLCLVATVFGAVVAGSILAFGRASGSHINPAVTLASAVREQRLDAAAASYIVIQVVAGLAAGGALLLVFRPGPGSAQLGSTSLSATVSPVVGLALEFAGTFVLATVALSASKVFPSIAEQAAAVGLTLIVLIVLIGPSTGASFNPVRSLGPAAAAAYAENLWIYVAGPLAGGALAGLLARPRLSS